MRSKRRSRRERSDAEILAHPVDMAILPAVAAGSVRRRSSSGPFGGDSRFLAPYLLDGESVRLPLQWLAREGLLRLPLSGPPELAERGRRLLIEAEQD